MVYLDAIRIERVKSVLSSHVFSLLGTSRYIRRHVHTCLRYLCHFTGFLWVNPFRTVHARVFRRRRRLNRGIGLMLNSSPASYAIRLHSCNDKRSGYGLPVRDRLGFHEKLVAFREIDHAIGSSTLISASATNQPFLPHPFPIECDCSLLSMNFLTRLFSFLIRRM